MKGNLANETIMYFSFPFFLITLSSILVFSTENLRIYRDIEFLMSQEVFTIITRDEIIDSSFFLTSPKAYAIIAGRPFEMSFFFHKNELYSLSFYGPDRTPDVDEINLNRDKA